MAPTIHQLDDLCLMRIFNELSIQHLFTVGRVCVRWNAIRWNSAITRKRLTLLIGLNAQRNIQNSVFRIPEAEKLVDENGERLFPLEIYRLRDAPLQVQSFSIYFAKFLLENLTNLTTLILSSDAHVDSIIHLLEHFSITANTQLKTLKFIHSRNIPLPERLLSVINSIESLTNLTLEFKWKTFLQDLDLPILGQLEQFEFNSDDDFSCLYESLLRYAVNNDGLMRIGIHSLASNFGWLLSLPHEFAFRFTQLHIDLNNSNMSRHGQFCLYFPNLTSLEIEIYRDHSVTRTVLFHQLSHLHNLLYLAINIDALSLSLTFENNDRDDNDDLNLSQVASLKVFSIKILDLLHNHNFLATFNLNHFFRNVQFVRVIRDDLLCQRCQNRARTPEYHCFGHMFKHLTSCEQLKTVGAQIGDQYRQWSMDDVNAFSDLDQVEPELVDRNAIAL